MSLQLRFIFQQLREDARVSSIVRDRIFPFGEVPETVTPPYITFQRISTTYYRDLEQGAGIGRNRWQINAWARSALESERLLDGIRLALNDFKGDVDINGEVLDVRRVMLEDAESDFEPGVDDSGRGFHVIRVDAIIVAGETVTP